VNNQTNGPKDEIQARTTDSYRIILMEVIVRIGYEPEVPQLIQVGGVAVFPKRGRVRKRSAGTRGDVAVYGGQFIQEYFTEEPPTKVLIPNAPNPELQIPN
jgi:hypothetical protein